MATEIRYPARENESIDRKRLQSNFTIASLRDKKETIKPDDFIVGQDVTDFVIDYYEYLGYSGHLAIPDDEDTGAQRLINQAQLWFRSMVVDNRFFPTNLPINFVLRSYIQALNNGDVKRPYANLVSQVEVFRGWLQANKNTLMDRAYTRGVIQRPKALQAENPVSEEERKKRVANGIKFLKATYGEEYKETKIYKQLVPDEGK